MIKTDADLGHAEGRPLAKNPAAGVGAAVLNVVVVVGAGAGYVIDPLDFVVIALRTFGFHQKKTTTAAAVAVAIVASFVVGELADDRTRMGPCLSLLLAWDDSYHLYLLPLPDLLLLSPHLPEPLLLPLL